MQESESAPFQVCLGKTNNVLVCLSVRPSIGIRVDY